MNGASDLAPLIGAATRQTSDVGFRQGTVLAWDGAAGTNSVEIGGVTVRNLPVLNLGDFTILQPGDVVALLRFQQTYFILGRVIPPQSPDVNRSTLAFAQSTGFASSITVTPTMTAVASTSIAVPTWADEAMVMVMATVSTQNTATTDDILMSVAYANGANGATMLTQAAPNARVAIASVASNLVTNPGATVTAEVRAQTNSGFSNTWVGDAFTAAYVAATVLFRRVS